MSVPLEEQESMLDRLNFVQWRQGLISCIDVEIGLGGRHLRVETLVFVDLVEDKAQFLSRSF